MLERDVRTGDGRKLRVREDGDPRGRAIFVHHGTPSAGLLFGPWVADAKARGIRLISHDRPGYGGSDQQPGRNVASVVGDIEAIAGELGIDRYATWGISGGGPHALACAALSERCVAAAALASIAPYNAEGLDFTAGMGEDNVKSFQLAIEQGRDALVDVEKRNAEMMLAAAPEDIFAGLESLVSDVDKAVMTDDFARFSYDCTHVALEGSIEGWLDDDMLFIDWGFDVADIGVPVLVYQGRQDHFVPFAHGEWLAANIPSAEARLTEEDGHLTLLVNRVSDTHAWLLERF